MAEHGEVKIQSILESVKKQLFEFKRWLKLQELDILVMKWHESDDDVELYKFMGMSWYEYSQWAQNPNNWYDRWLAGEFND